MNLQLTPIGCLFLGALLIVPRAGAVGPQASAPPQQAPSPAPPVAAPPVESSPEPQPPAGGQILIQSHGDPPSTDTKAPDGQQPSQSATQPEEGSRVDISDQERSAPTITQYNLDVRLRPSQSGLEVRAKLVVRNDGDGPMRFLPLQVSSSLHWESATLLDGTRRVSLALNQHRLDTDADHTGAASEAVLALPAALAPGASATLDLFYAGKAGIDSDRLARLGATAQAREQADWDQVSEDWTGLRGFGNVLWYPVAAPQLFLAEGNTLYTAVGKMRQREASAGVELHLSVEYRGEAPAAAYFCGRRAPLNSLADDPNASLAEGGGLATADFPLQPLGFRLLSLFLIQEPETLLNGSAPEADSSAAPPGVSSSNSEASSQLPTTSGTAAQDPSQATSGSASSSNPQPEPTLRSRPPRVEAGIGEPIVALVSRDRGTAAGLGEAAAEASTLLQVWLGPKPLSALTVLDHNGQAFQDGPLLVAPASTLQTSPERPALVYSLTHAWVQTGQPWMDEGLAQFFALLSVERSSGRTAALDQLNGLLQPVALAEPELHAATDQPLGQPITTASDEFFYRRKAAAVWWMLRDLAGEAPLRAALRAWRTQRESDVSPQAQAEAFEHLLEKLSGKDLHWFFADWVLRDRGLPDLSIADVAVSPSPGAGGRKEGFLVAVTVHNAGGAAARVPVTLQSGNATTTENLLVPGFGQTTQRILVPVQPSTVTVNDGSVPELASSIHTRTLAVAPRQE